MVSSSPIPWNMGYIVLFQIKYFGKIKYSSYLPTLPLIMMVTGNTKLISLGLTYMYLYPNHRQKNNMYMYIPHNAPYHIAPENLHVFRSWNQGMFDAVRSVHLAY